MATVTFDEATWFYPRGDGPLGGPAEPADRRRGVPGPRRTLRASTSTALRMLAGLEPVDGVRILIDDRDVTHLPWRQRDTAMVFRSSVLFPHMTAEDSTASR